LGPPTEGPVPHAEGTDRGNDKHDPYQPGTARAFPFHARPSSSLGGRTGAKGAGRGPDLAVWQYLREIGTNARRKRRARKCYGLSDRSYVSHFTLEEKRGAARPLTGGLGAAERPGRYRTLGGVHRVGISSRQEGSDGGGQHHLRAGRKTLAARDASEGKASGDQVVRLAKGFRLSKAASASWRRLYGKACGWPQPPERNGLGPRHMKGPLPCRVWTDPGINKHDPCQLGGLPPTLPPSCLGWVALAGSVD
jgi:hypothetical protein